MIKSVLLAALAAFTAAPLAAAPFTVEKTGQSFDRLNDAVGAIAYGDGVILIDPGHYGDCAVQTAGNITYRAKQPLTAFFDGGYCEGKATLVLRGRYARVEGLVFENIRVPDGNGAGIRLEAGPLTVVNSSFRNSDSGILGGADDSSVDVVVDRSSFSGLGRCDRGLSCAHSIYLGGLRAVIVTRSRFEQGRGGHYLKSRAARIMVSDSTFDDSKGRATNYMIDLPEGATGRIERNSFLQGADKENHGALIAVAAEGRRNNSNGLVVANNRASQVAAARSTTVLVSDWSRSQKQLDGNVLGLGVQLSR